MWKWFFTLILTGAVLLFGSGCSEEAAPEPPTSRAELTQRLFEALQTKRDEDALAIVDKLLALDNDDSDLMEMRERIMGNICTRHVQKLIDARRLDEARKYVNQQRRRHPGLTKLQFLEEEVNALITLRDAANALAEAATVADLTAALEKIAPLAAKYPAARNLKRDITRRRNDLKQMRRTQSAPRKP